jgi:hypothetical protein
VPTPVPPPSTPQKENILVSEISHLSKLLVRVKKQKKQRFLVLFFFLLFHLAKFMADYEPKWSKQLL